MPARFQADADLNQIIVSAVLSSRNTRFAARVRHQRVEGVLAGPTGMLQVVSVWMRRAIDNRFHFVTLKPSRERSDDVPSAL